MSTDNKALAIIPRTVEDVRSLSKMFAQSALLPPDLRGKEADVFVSIMAGQELGLPPMAALRGVHVVKGKPVLSADTMVGIVLGSGLAEYFSCVEESAESVTYETRRKGSPHPQTCSWTMADARTAGLGGDNWKKYPRAMLKARCKAMLARDVYPDVLAGCYEHDEAREFSDPAPSSAPNNVIEAEFRDAPSPKASTPIETRQSIDDDSDLDVIEKTQTEKELGDLVPMISKLPDAKKGRARARWAAQRTLIRDAEKREHAS